MNFFQPRSVDDFLLSQELKSSELNYETEPITQKWFNINDDFEISGLESADDELPRNDNTDSATPFPNSKSKSQLNFDSDNKSAFLSSSVRNTNDIDKSLADLSFSSPMRSTCLRCGVDSSSPYLSQSHDKYQTSSSVLTAFRELQSKAKRLESDRDDAIKLRDELKAKISSTFLEREAININDIHLRENLSATRTSIVQLKSSINILKSKILSNEEISTSLQQKLSSRKILHKDIEDEYDDIQKRIHHLNEKNSQLQRQYEVVSIRNDNYHSRIIEGETFSLQEAKADLKAQILSLERDLSNMKLNIVNTNRQVDATERYIQLILSINSDLLQTIRTSEFTKGKILEFANKATPRYCWPKGIEYSNPQMLDVIDAAATAAALSPQKLRQHKKLYNSLLSESYIDPSSYRGIIAPSLESIRRNSVYDNSHEKKLYKRFHSAERKRSDREVYSRHWPSESTPPRKRSQSPGIRLRNDSHGFQSALGLIEPRSERNTNEFKRYSDRSVSPSTILETSATNSAIGSKSLSSINYVDLDASKDGGLGGPFIPPPREGQSKEFNSFAKQSQAHRHATFRAASSAARSRRQLT